MVKVMPKSAITQDLEVVTQSIGEQEVAALHVEPEGSR
jgi:hypothetical protein